MSQCTVTVVIEDIRDDAKRVEIVTSSSDVNQAIDQAKAQANAVVDADRQFVTALHDSVPQGGTP